jgi:hypothetical protein
MAIKTFTTGEVLTAADTNTYLANSGLVYIASGSLSGTSTTFTNCFSSTYDSYRVLFRATGTVGNTVFLKFNGSTGATYNVNGFYTIAGLTPLNGIADQNISSGINCGYLPSAGFISAQIDIRAPFLAEQTGLSVLTSGNPYCWSGNGVDTNAVSSTNLLITCGVSITGTAAIYGYRKA